MRMNCPVKRNSDVLPIVCWISSIAFLLTGSSSMEVERTAVVGDYVARPLIAMA
jgi:hypothetical protein